MLSEKETEKIKKQLIEHIEKSFPEEKKDFAIQKIISMSPHELEEFLVKNNLLKKEIKVECVFCGIVANIIESKKIGETKNSIAVLEINPLSKGHVLIIPKEHFSSSEKIKIDSWKLVKKISKKIKEKLKPKDIKIETVNFFGHEIINLIPLYKGSDEKNLVRKKANFEELEYLKEILSKKEMRKPEKKIEKTVELIKPRIP
ncbi:MAG: hypothetical protein KatS3mg001_382 [Candidatus Pacearchaeota archaeon]|nr:MAG: hypothetical protein KatS3mg001_382 [Candidatus Pacearchaeota archaeon]